MTSPIEYLNNRFSSGLPSHLMQFGLYGRAKHRIQWSLLVAIMTLASLLLGSSQIQASSYDLRLYDRVTPVKYQGTYGNCWSYATMASIESNMLTQGFVSTPSSPSVDYSESHLSRFYDGNDSGVALAGGNRQKALSYLARGRGPVLESQYSFPGSTGDPYSSYAYSPQCWVTAQQWIDTDNPAAPASIADIQNAIVANGAVATSMYWNDYYFNSSNNTYYYSGGTSTNHAVSLVGWDDAKTTASSNPGAWLVKNSWDTWFGDEGYFWLSYDDTAGLQNATSYQTAAANAYSGVYENQTNSPDRWWGASHGASKFTTDGVGFLDGVGFVTQEHNVQYDIRVYDSWSGGAPSGLLATQSGTQEWPGYYVVDFDDPILLNNNDSFVITIEFSGGLGSGYYLAADSTCGDPSGTNYVSTDGNYWYDASSVLSGDNVLFIKALTSNIPGDANRDGYVDSTDVAILSDHWGETAMGWAMGDFDADGMVGPKDASILAAHWGYDLSESLSSSAIPEPGTFVLILGTSIVCLVPRRYRRSR